MRCYPTKHIQGEANIDIDIMEATNEAEDARRLNDEARDESNARLASPTNSDSDRFYQREEQRPGYYRGFFQRGCEPVREFDEHASSAVSPKDDPLPLRRSTRVPKATSFFGGVGEAALGGACALLGALGIGPKKASTPSSVEATTSTVEHRQHRSGGGTCVLADTSLSLIHI